LTAVSEEILELRRRLEEAEATLLAIREGQVDALVVAGADGDHVFTLRTADHPYRILVETMNEGAVTVLADGTILYANRRMAEMLQQPREKIVGESIFNFIVPDYRQMCLDLLKTGLEGRGSGELQLVRRERAVLPVVFSVNRVEIDDTRAICLIATDLTAQKRNEEIVRSERLARAILEQACEAIVVCDASGRIIHANEAARSLTKGRAVGEMLETVLPLRLLDCQEKLFSIARVLKGDRLQGAQLCLEWEGLPTKYLLVSAGPLVDGEGVVTGCVVTLTDFTETRNATTELMRINSELEQFAFAAAHDLQEPLRMISTYSQLLIRRRGEKVEAESRQFAFYIESGIKRMQALLQDLLSYSRVSYDGESHRQLVDCNQVLRVVLQNCDAAIRETSAELNAEDLPSVYANPAELLEVFQNLVSNALKYCAASPPRIQVFAMRGEREHTFAVQDNGIGFDPKYSDRIFGLFKRLHGQEYPGTGIGLAICKRVVEKHKGRIWVESQPGQGSTFYFTMPAVAEHSTAGKDLRTLLPDTAQLPG
jgi:PAS domain S-box-containing protein